MLAHLLAVEVAATALLSWSALGAGPANRETDQEMVRLAIKLGQPDRNLSSELQATASKENVDVPLLKRAAKQIVSTRAHFDELDKVLAAEAVKVAVLDDTPIERVADLVERARYDLGWGSEARKLLWLAFAAGQKTPNLKAVDAAQLVVDMQPYWLQAHRLTGISAREISLAKASTVMTIQKILYQTYPNKPAAAHRILYVSGLTAHLVTAEDSFFIGSALGLSPTQWAERVDRFQRGEVDLIFNDVRTIAQRLDTQGLLGEAPRSKLPAERTSDALPSTPTERPGTAESRGVGAGSKSVPPEIAVLLERWRTSALQHNLEAQVACYAPVLEVYFKRTNVPLSQVRIDKGSAFSSYPDIRAYTITNLHLESLGEDRASVVFRKDWDAHGSSGQFAGAELERLTFRLSNGLWQIVGEQEITVYWVKKEPR